MSYDTNNLQTNDIEENLQKIDGQVLNEIIRNKSDRSQNYENDLQFRDPQNFESIKNKILRYKDELDQNNIYSDKNSDLNNFPFAKENDNEYKKEIRRGSNLYK